MDKRFIFECVMALVGGFVGASVSALGSFLIFGLLGTIGFFYLITLGDNTLLLAVTGGVLFLPHVSFVGGAVAIAYARKQGVIECGKDIGRSALSLQRWDVLAVGAVAGLAGYLVNRFLGIFLYEGVDTIALTVVLIPLILKYVWSLERTNDCEGSSHAVPSPFRFFERLQKPLGKVALSVAMGVIAALLVVIFHSAEETTHYSEMLLFFLAAASLYLLFMKYSIPATHHLAAASGAVLTSWLSENGMPTEPLFLLILFGWSTTFSLLAMSAADFLKRLFFDEGDIHVDPPAMGIVVTTLVAMGLFPMIGLYKATIGVQIIVILIISISAIVINLQFLKGE